MTESNQNSSRNKLKKASPLNLFLSESTKTDKHFDYNSSPNSYNHSLFYQGNSRSTLKVSSTYLPPLNHKSSSKDLDSIQNLNLELSFIKTKPRSYSLHKNSVIHSSSEQNIRRNHLNYLPKIEENNNFELGHIKDLYDHTQAFTPTFRNISLEKELKTDKVKNKVCVLGKFNESSVIFPVSQKKILDVQSQNKQGTRRMVSQTMKKIKVLHHKFPKDMFVVNDNINNHLN